MKSFNIGDFRVISAAVNRLSDHERIMVVDPDDDNSVVYEVMKVPKGFIYVHWDQETSTSVFVK